MKSKIVKPTIAMLLALVLTLGLCACGGKEGGTGVFGGSTGGKNKENAQLAKENVYKVQNFEIPQFVDSDNGYVNVRSTVHMDGKIYMLFQINDWTNEVETDIRMMSMNEDGTDVNVISLNIPNQGQSQTTDLTEEILPEEDGSETAVDAEAEVPEDEADAEEDYKYENTGYDQFVMTKSMKIFGIKNYYHEETAENGDYINEQKSYLCTWNMDGSFVNEVELEGLKSEEEWTYVTGLYEMKDGTVYIMINGDKSYKMKVSADGNVSEKMALSEEASEAMKQNQNLLVKDDGTCLIIYNDQEDWSKIHICDYNLETDTIGEKSLLPSSMSWNGYNNLTAGINTDLVYTSSTGVYTYNRGDEDGKMKMSFINSDLNITGFDSFVELSDTQFIGLYRENNSEDFKAGIFTYVDPKDIQDKEVIVFAGNYVGSDVKQRVVEFNRSSEAYRIVVKEYDSYNTYEDYTAGVTKLNNDIITGNMPDILMTDGLPMENYIAKGLIADVNELIKKDEELSKTEFMQNVFDAYSIDDKLYYIVPSFGVSTMIAKTALVGDKTNWTMADMQAVLKDMPEGTQAIGDVTRDGFMNMVMQYCGGDFVDVKTGKCNFNSDNFISMMEYAKTLPEEIDWEERNNDTNYWETYEAQYRENRTLLCSAYIGSFSNMIYTINGYFGEPITFVGFPTESGKGSYINAYGAYALSAKSSNLEGAWEFVRYYLTDEYQEKLDWGLSVNKKIFMEQAQKATRRPSYIDSETGEEVEYDETFYINGEEIILDPLTQEQVDQMVAFVESVDVGYYYNESISNIVEEEIGAFYSGQKTAAEVADFIQRRVQIYVDENR